MVKVCAQELERCGRVQAIRKKSSSPATQAKARGLCWIGSHENAAFSKRLKKPYCRTSYATTVIA